MLPIPDILERAANVIRLAKEVAAESERSSEWPNQTIIDLKKSLKMVTPEDLLAVMNEVGKVYIGMHNIQIQSIGCRPVPEKRVLEMLIQMEYGLGPKNIFVPWKLQEATEIVKNFNDALSAITTVSPTGLITG